MNKQCTFLFSSILALSFFIPTNIYATEINYNENNLKIIEISEIPDNLIPIQVNSLSEIEKFINELEISNTNQTIEISDKQKTYVYASGTLGYYFLLPTGITTFYHVPVDLSATVIFK